MRDQYLNLVCDMYVYICICVYTCIYIFVHVCVCVYMYRLLCQNLMGDANQQSTIESTIIQKWKSNPNPILKIVIKSKEKWTREEKDLQRWIQSNDQNSNKIIHIISYLKCKWNKCSHQKTETSKGYKNKICYLQETNFRSRGKNRLKVRE